ncbi:MAG: type II CAAX endopeptidase family protein, partial [Marinirhabdus sp.]|nr:type II CAAX endopeptidase family protein [Marinirhabdus sp.]
MVGILIILVISWLLLHFLASENLKVLGPFPIRKRTLQLGVGFLVALLLNSIIIFTEASIRDASWEVQSVSWHQVQNAVYYYFKSVLYEDLLFRGALLYLLMTKTKPWIGMLLSAVAFGIYHWFSFGLLDSGIVVLIYVFGTTGFMGWVWADAFRRTQSMALGMGMHLGWNLTTACFLVTQPYGELFLSATDGSTFSENMETILAITKGLLPPLLFLLFIQKYYKKTET